MCRNILAYQKPDLFTNKIFFLLIHSKCLQSRISMMIRNFKDYEILCVAVYIWLVIFDSEKKVILLFEEIICPILRHIKLTCCTYWLCFDGNIFVSIFLTFGVRGVNFWVLSDCQMKNVELWGVKLRIFRKRGVKLGNFAKEVSN